MPSYTPGPWRVTGKDMVFAGGHSVEDGHVIARIAQIGIPAITEANARLIAAAPRMLEFIRAAAKLDLGCSDVSGAKARAILRDVEGESNG